MRRLQVMILTAMGAAVVMSMLLPDSWPMWARGTSGAAPGLVIGWFLAEMIKNDKRF